MNESHFEFFTAENGDIIVIKKQHTGSGSTEVHILSAQENYKKWSLQTGTPLHETDDSFHFMLAHNRDIIALKLRGTGSGSTEVHILSAKENYKKWSLQTGTPLHEIPAAPQAGTGTCGVINMEDRYSVLTTASGSVTVQLSNPCVTQAPGFIFTRAVLAEDFSDSTSSPAISLPAGTVLTAIVTSKTPGSFELSIRNEADQRICQARINLFYSAFEKAS